MLLPLFSFSRCFRCHTLFWRLKIFHYLLKLRQTIAPPRRPNFSAISTHFWTTTSPSEDRRTQNLLTLFWTLENKSKPAPLTLPKSPQTKMNKVKRAHSLPLQEKPIPRPSWLSSTFQEIPHGINSPHILQCFMINATLELMPTRLS